MADGCVVSQLVAGKLDMANGKDKGKTKARKTVPPVYVGPSQTDGVTIWQGTVNSANPDVNGKKFQFPLPAPLREP